MKRWLKLLVPLLAGVVVLGLYIGLYTDLTDLFNPERRQISEPYYLMGLDLDTAEGFAEVDRRGPRLVLRQGEVGKVNITLKRQYTEDRLSISLRFYGTAPEFDEWTTTVGVPMDDSGPKQALPEGVTYSFDPSLVALTTDEVYLSTLTIAARPDAQIGSFKLTVEAHLRYPTYEHTTGLMGYSLILEIRPSGQ